MLLPGTTVSQVKTENQINETINLNSLNNSANKDQNNSSFNQTRNVLGVTGLIQSNANNPISDGFGSPDIELGT